ncbi:MAG TPA: hypothetical protein VNG53_11965 [Bacteroidia bacterium]|nr:hypothetical protein [Bacteroidia bacterium]
MKIFISEADRQSARRIAIKNIARFYNLSDWESKPNDELLKEIYALSEKSAVQSAFTDKVNLFKEELTEKYFLAKQTALDDYLIFMAIAEDIGYDATGRNTNNNELTEIGIELSKFIAHINKTEK